MDNMFSGKGTVRLCDHFASSAKKLGIKEFEKSRMPQQHPAQVRRHKANYSFPFTGLEAIGQQQRHATIPHKQRTMTDGAYFSLGGVRQIESKTNGQALGKKGIIRRTVDTTVEGRQ
jgi:hypothetical protein